MSKNLDGVYLANPSVSLPANALLYAVLPPYNSGSDTAILMSDFQSQVGGVSPQNIQNQDFTFQGTDTGTADNYAISMSPPLSAYAGGQSFWFIPANTSLTTTPQINIDGLGNLPMFNFSEQGLQIGDIQQFIPVQIKLNSTGAAALVQNPYSLGFLNISIVQNNAAYFFDSGSTNAFVLSMANGLPPLTAYQNGQVMWFRSNNSTTGATTADVDGLGAVSIVNPDFSDLSTGSMLSGVVYFLFYTAGHLILMNSSLNASAVQIQNQAFNFATDSGTSNAYALTVNPPITAYADGQRFSFIAASGNTGASTISVSGLGTVGLTDESASNLLGDEIYPTFLYDVAYNSALGVFILLNPSLNTTSVDLQNQTYTYSVDSGVADAYIANPNPQYNALIDGIRTCVRISNTNITTTPTLTLGVFSATLIVGKNGLAVAPGDLLANVSYDFQYNSALSAFQLI